MIDPSRHAESRNPLESLLSQIPGFKGYLEREYRRDSDQLLRTWMADRLQQGKTQLDGWQRRLLDAGQIDRLPDCERLRSQIDTLQSRIKGAMRGYSGFFDFVRIDAAVLDSVYQLDLGIAQRVVDVLRVIESGMGDSPQSTLSELGKRVDELGRQFDRRHELLEGLM